MEHSCVHGCRSLVLNSRPPRPDTRRLRSVDWGRSGGVDCATPQTSDRAQNVPTLRNTHKRRTRHQPLHCHKQARLFFSATMPTKDLRQRHQGQTLGIRSCSGYALVMTHSFLHLCCTFKDLSVIVGTLPCRHGYETRTMLRGLIRRMDHANRNVAFF